MTSGPSVDSGPARTVPVRIERRWKARFISRRQVKGRFQSASETVRDNRPEGGLGIQLSRFANLGEPTDPSRHMTNLIRQNAIDKASARLITHIPEPSPQAGRDIEPSCLKHHWNDCKSRKDAVARLPRRVPEAAMGRHRPVMAAEFPEPG